ncbi:unnamed protein product [Tilletia controversa]|nr:unnamed protein product [Tilletia controversa]
MRTALTRLFPRHSRLASTLKPSPRASTPFAAAHPTRGVFVDPYTLSTVQDRAREEAVEDVVGCITTHHHHDHSGGNADFANAYPSAPIYGGSDQVPKRAYPVQDGYSFPLFPGSSINALDARFGAWASEHVVGQPAHHEVVEEGRKRTTRIVEENLFERNQARSLFLSASFTTIVFIRNEKTSSLL